MAGLKTVLPVALTDTSLPIVYDDSLLTSGSLMLVDMGHSTRPGITAGSNPVSGTDVANIADSIAATLLGVSASNTHPTFTKDAGWDNGTVGRMERTPKGALHGMTRQATAATAAVGAMFVMPAALRNYMAANPTHQFYQSIWGYVTRVSGKTTGPYPVYQQAMNDAAGFKGMSYVAALPYTSGSAGFVAPNSGQTHDTRPSTNGNPMFVGFAGKIEQSGWTDATLATDNHRNIAAWGAVGAGAVTASNIPSWAFYRYYLEDLTVSGRTWATIDAIDFARYTADVLTSGGKYYGDTFSSPATVVP